MGKSKKACELFSQSFNCAQSVFVPFCRDFGLDERLALKISTPFGGGMGCGGPCGALVGALMVIGLVNGRSQPDDLQAKKDCSSKSAAFTKAFNAHFGATTCPALLKLRTQGLSDVNRRLTCKDIVTGTVELLTNTQDLCIK